MYVQFLNVYFLLNSLYENRNLEVKIFLAKHSFDKTEVSHELLDFN